MYIEEDQCDVRHEEDAKWAAQADYEVDNSEPFSAYPVKTQYGDICLALRMEQRGLFQTLTLGQARHLHKSLTQVLGAYDRGDWHGYFEG
jgi:hypothetical protein